MAPVLPAAHLSSQKIPVDSDRYQSYGFRDKDTGSMVTREKDNHRRTAADSQPIPRFTSVAERATAKESSISDAQRLVKWLNGAKRTASHDRVMFIRNELEALPRDFVANAEAYTHASNGVVQIGQALGDWPKYKLEIQQQLFDRHTQLNTLLERYIFRPRATYVIARRWWLLGMAPDDNRRWHKLQFGYEVISEPDAVLSLLRLAETGDLRKVRLCKMCNERWLFAGKRNYRFCSDQCRERFYAKSPDYHSRKAANQRKYREKLKRINAQAASFKGR